MTVTATAPAVSATSNPTKGQTAPTSVPTPSNQPAAPNGHKPPPPGRPDYKGTKHWIKEDGVEREVDYEEMRDGYRKAAVAEKRYQEAAKEKAEAQRLYKDAQLVKQALERGDSKFLIQVMGEDKAIAMMEKELIERMQYDQLPQHEKDLRTERQKREAAESQLKERDQSQDQQRYQQLADQAFKDLDEYVGAELKSVGKPVNPRLALRIVEQYEAEILKGQRLGAGDGWKRASEGLREDIKMIVPDMSPQELVEFFGQDTIDKLMKHKVGQVLDGKGQKRASSPKAPTGPVKPMTIDEKFAAIEQKFKRR